MRFRRRPAVFGFMFVATVTAIASVSAVSVAAAATEESRAAAEIQAFVDRADEKFGISIDGADYELRQVGGETWILRKDAETPQVTTTRHKSQAGNGPDTVEKVFTPGPTSPPTPDEAAQMEAAGEVTIMQDTAWYQPVCNENITDPQDAGHMFACFKWGDMNYLGETRQNWAFHMYGSCWPGGATFYEVTECYVDTVKHPTSAILFWNSRSPGGTVPFNPCGTLTLSITAGPVNAGWSHQSCGVIVPEWGSEPADMRTRMVDDIYYSDEVRETAQIIGIGAAFNVPLVVAPSFGYFYQQCEPFTLPYLCG